MEKFLEQFSSILEEGRYKGESFAGICGIMGVNPEKFDRYLRGIFGYTGEEIVKAYHTGIPVSML